MTPPNSLDCAQADDVEGCGFRAQFIAALLQVADPQATGDQARETAA